MAERPAARSAESSLPRFRSPQELREVLDSAVVAPPIHARPRIRGLRLVATALDWSRGRGPEVTAHVSEPVAG